MNKTLILALGIASTAAIVSAHAQTYQWKDAGGRTVISDTPPRDTKGARAVGATQPGVASEKPSEKIADTAKTTAEKDMEFKKRQQEAREKADKDAKEQVAARDRQENCENARRNLAVFEGNVPLVTFDDKGQRIMVEDEQRNREIERTRRIIAESCK